MITDFDADIICVQEMNFPTFEEDFGDFMRASGYCTVVQRPSGDRFDMATATFYRTDKFSLEWENHRSRALLLGLRNRRTGKLVVVANVHLQGGVNEEAHRISQLKSLLKQVKKYMKTDERLSPCFDDGKNYDNSFSDGTPSSLLCPIVIAGDFNCDEKAAPHRFLRGEGEFSLKKGHHGMGKQGFKNAYDISRSQEELSTFWAHGDFCCIDFIYYQGLQVITLLDNLPGNRRDILLQTSLPNHFNPSDHLPIGCVFDEPAMDHHRHGSAVNGSDR